MRKNGWHGSRRAAATLNGKPAEHPLDTNGGGTEVRAECNTVPRQGPTRPVPPRPLLVTEGANILGLRSSISIREKP